MVMAGFGTPFGHRKVGRWACVVTCAALSVGASAETYTWTGEGGQWASPASWSPAGVPSAGDTAVFSASADISSDFSVGAGETALTICAESGATVRVSGAVSGSAPIVLEGGGVVELTGANVFTGALSVRCGTFRALSDGAFGSTEGGTTFTARDATTRWHFCGITTGEDLSFDNSPGGNAIEFPAASTNVFNGAWRRLKEQYRGTLREHASVRFNKDFAGGVQYMTFALDDGATLDFNASFSSLGDGGMPRLSGTGTVIYRKPVTVKRQSDYGFSYQFGGTMKFLGENILGTGPDAAAISSHLGNYTYRSTLDLAGNGQTCAYLAAYATDIVSTGGEATLRVLNDLAPTKCANGGVFAGKVIGRVNVSVEGCSGLDALTLSGSSESMGTLSVRSGGKAVFTETGAWGDGDVDIGNGSSVTVLNADALGRRSAVRIEDNGTLTVPEGIALSVRALTLGSEQGVYGQTYAAADSPLDGVVRTHLIQGGGTVVVCGGDVRTWKGPEGGAWSEPSNWTPEGVPGDGDTLRFDASTAAVSSVNDLSGLSVAALEFSGGQSIAVSGNEVNLAGGGGLSAEGCCGGVSFGLPLAFSGEREVVIRSVASGADVSAWTFTGAWRGASPVRFDGDHTGVYSFRQVSPSFDGELRLVNAGEYHLHAAAALGSTVGKTRYEVRQGDYMVNSDRVVEPLYLHGIDTSENFHIAGLASRSLHFAAGTTNHLRGAVDVPQDRYDTNVPDTERFVIGRDARLTVSGPVSRKALDGSDVFDLVLLVGEEGSMVELASEWGACGGIRACPAAGAELVLKHPQAQTGFVGIFGGGTLRMACENALGVNGETPLSLGSNRPNAIDLGGHALTVGKVTPYGGHDSYARATTFANGSLVLTRADTVLKGSLGLGLSVRAAMPGILSLLPASCASDVALVVDADAHVVVGESVALPLATLTVRDGGRFELSASASLARTGAVSVEAGGKVILSATVDQAIGSLALGGVSQAGGLSYGSAESDAEVRDSAYFGGTGKFRLLGMVDATARQWKGPLGGKWSDPDNWEPKGAIGYGNALVFDSGDRAAISSVNDLTHVKASAIRLMGRGEIVLAGEPCGILTSGEGLSGADGSTARVRFDLPISLIPDSAGPLRVRVGRDQTFAFHGSIGGAADLLLTGSGAVELRGDNAFTGMLTVENGILDVYSDAAFGTCDGKTVFLIPDSVADGGRPPAVTFHGITTSEVIEWRQNYGEYAGFFPENTTNVFNGAFTGTGGQPRWQMRTNAEVRMNGSMSGVNVFTVMSGKGSRYVVGGAYSASNFRFSGDGELRVANTLSLNAPEYALLYESGSPLLAFAGENLLKLSDAAYGVPPLSVAVGTVDLNGHAQQALSLCGTSSATITNSGARAGIRLLAHREWNVPCSGGIAIGKLPPYRFAGRIMGPVDLTVEGAAAPVQYLSGANASTGTLTVVGGAAVCLEGNGQWSGPVDVRAGSRLIFEGAGRLGRVSDLWLSGDAEVQIPAGMSVRIRDLYVDGVRQPHGKYGPQSGGGHFPGEGVLCTSGGGMKLVVR